MAGCAASRRKDRQATWMTASGQSLAPSEYCRHCQGSDGTVGAEQRGIGCNVETQQQMQNKNEAASAHCCNNEGGRPMKGTKLLAAARLAKERRH